MIKIFEFIDALTNRDMIYFVLTFITLYLIILISSKKYNKLSKKVYSDMPIIENRTVICPHCVARITTSVENVNRIIKCVVCGKTFLKGR